MILRFHIDEQYTQYDSPSVGIILVRKDPLDFDDEVTTDSDTSNSSFEIDDSEKDTKNSAGSFGSSNKSQGYKLRLWCAFTTDSMAIGYTSSYAKDKVMVKHFVTSASCVLKLTYINMNLIHGLDSYSASIHTRKCYITTTRS